MAVGDEQRLITPISQRQFELYALSLERGPNFDPAQVFGSYQAGRGSTSGCILLDPEVGTFTTLALRRRVDHRWVRVDEGGPYPTPEAALDHLSISMRAGEPPEPLPPGARRRSLLLKTGSRGTSPEFDLLTSTISHFPALMAVGECYLALPNPDANFVTDLQTNNFASRLFELYLLACFREQGLIVRQEHVSPDFLIENDGTACWIEAVTANSETPRSGGIGDWVHAPVDRNERLTGAPAERFAKTLRGKLQRNYHELDHVKGMPFALAIADFHESGSMVWSREALPTYLLGSRVHDERSRRLREGAWARLRPNPAEARDGNSAGRRDHPCDDSDPRALKQSAISADRRAADSDDRGLQSARRLVLLALHGLPYDCAHEAGEPAARHRRALKPGNGRGPARPAPLTQRGARRAGLFHWRR